MHVLGPEKHMEKHERPASMNPAKALKLHIPVTYLQGCVDGEDLGQRSALINTRA